MIKSAFAVNAILGMAAVTILLRAAPFFCAPYLRRFKMVDKLGQFLPPAIMALLLIHTLKSNMMENSNGPWQELIAAAVAIVLQWRIRHPLISIAGATLLYIAFRNITIHF